MTNPTNNLRPVPVTGLTFSDDFTSFSASADGVGTVWQDLLPYGGEAAHTLSGNDEGEYYSSALSGPNSPFSDQDGILNISAFPAAAGSNPYGLPYTSGVITTAQSFSQTYGYFEVDAKLPAGTGLWPAFWMLPTDGYTAELDDFEVVNNDNEVNSTVHGTTNGSWGTDFQSFPTAVNLADSFNVFGFDWTPTTVTFYLNGVAYGSAPTPTSMDSPMYMLLNLAVGGAGSWPGSPTASTVFPADMQIAWVQAYSTQYTSYVGGSAAITPGSPASVVDGSGSSSGASAVVAETPPTIAGTVAGQTTASDSPIDPFSGVTITDPNSGATDTLDITLSGSGGTLSGSGLTAYTGGIYSLSGSAATITAELDALSFRPTAGAAGSSNSTSFTLSDQSSVTGAPVIDSTTSVTDVDPATPVVTAAVDPAGVTLGTGPDQLVLQLAEDYYAGNANFTVEINGVQVGGTLTTSAIEGDGEAQFFTIDGSFPVGTNTVTVDFLNDLYGGTAQTDRNLFVEGATINGTAVSNAVLNEYSGGPQSFSFTQAGPPRITGTLAGQATTSNATLKPFSGVTVADPNSGATDTLTITLTGSGGALTGTVSGSSLAGGAGGVYTLTGTAASITTQLDALVFTPTGGAAGSSNTTKFALSDSSSAGASPVTDSSTSVTDIEPAVPVDPAGVTVGAGPDQLVLQIAEDYYLGNANFTVDINGVQQGGTLTTSAIEGAGEVQSFTIDGSFPVGTDTVTVDFLNDLYGGTSQTDRNLFVESATINGAAVNNATLDEYSAGPQSFSFIQAGPPTITGALAGQTTTLEAMIKPFAGVTVADPNGGATDSLAVTLTGSGGTLSGSGLTAGTGGVYALAGSAAAITAELDALTFTPGAGAAGSSNTTNFTLRDTSSASQTVATDSTTTVVDTDPAKSAVSTAQAANPPPIIVGSGPDQLVLHLSEDEFLGNATLTVDVNGVQQGGTLTTSAINGDGETQNLVINGTFGTGTNSVSVDFLNDLYAGTPQTDRNLYVDGATINGSTIANANLNEYSDGTQSFSFTGNDAMDASQPAATVVPAATGASPQTTPDTLTIGLTEDAYRGNAKASMAIDGTTLGSPTVTFLNSGTGVELFTFTGDFGGPDVAHNLAVSFLNDLYGGSATMDRNLYLKSVSFDGTALPDQAALYSTGTMTYVIPASTPLVGLSNQHSV